MAEKKIENLKKVKRALIEKQNIIRDKFQSTLKNRLGSERKLNEKYKPILKSIKDLKSDDKKKKPNRRNREENEGLFSESDEMGDDDDRSIYTDIDPQNELVFGDYYPPSTTPQQQQSNRGSVRSSDHSNSSSGDETHDDDAAVVGSDPIKQTIKREPVSDYDEFEDVIEDYATKKTRVSKNSSKKLANIQQKRRLAVDFRKRKLSAIKKKYTSKPFPALKRRGSPETVENIRKDVKLDEADHARLLIRRAPIVRRMKKSLEQIQMVRNAHPPIQPQPHELGQERSPKPGTSKPHESGQERSPKPGTSNASDTIGFADSGSDGSDPDLPRPLDPFLFSKAVTDNPEVDEDLFSRTATCRASKQPAYIHNPLRKRSRVATHLDPKKLQRFNSSNVLENIRRLRQIQKSTTANRSRPDRGHLTDTDTDERDVQSKKSRKKSGKGLQNEFVKYGDRVVYEYYDDPNELCDRLKLLVSSKQAGNTNHDYEINSIVEELREAEIIY